MVSICARRSIFSAARSVVLACGLWCVAILSTAPVHAQSFFQQMALGTVLVGPDALGLDANTPPDLDEPQIGEDPETAPFSAPAQDSSGQNASARAKDARRRAAFGGAVFHGQSASEAAPLPLADRLRRALRDSVLGGGEDIWFQRAPTRDVYFLAYDTSRKDHYVSFGAKHAIRGDFSTQGWRFLSTLGSKLATYDPAQRARTLSIDLVRLMPGYELRLGGLTLSGFAGLGYARSQASGITATGRFGRYGANALAEFWYDWGQRAPALARFTSAYVLGESANRSLALGLRHGVALPWLSCLVGPEAGWSAGRDVRAHGGQLHSAYRKGRLGLHASEIPLFAARLRVSAGAQWDNGKKTGGYAELAAYVAY